MIIDKIGDILHTEADVICHQVNCKGVMGAGLAKQIRNQIPIKFTIFLERTFLQGPELIPYMLLSIRHL